MHYNGDIQMADINQQERDEFQALIRGYGQGPRSFTANAGVQSDPVGGLTPVGQAIGKGIDTVSDIAKSTADAVSTIANTPISVTNDDGTTTVSPFGQQGNTFQAIGQLGQSLPNALPASFVSNTDRLFLYNNDQLRANEALRIAKTLNIGADTVMFGDDKAFERADYLSRRAERGQVLQDIYDEFPELYKVKYGSQAEGIQALNNIESIKNTKGIFDSIQQSIWAMNDQMKLGDVGFALAYESDPQKISELTAEVNRLQNNLQNYRRPDGGSPLQEVLGSTASQIYMMGKQGGTGAIVGGVIGGIGGGVVSGGSAAIPSAMTGAKWLGSADMAYEMYKMSFGNKYLELIGKRDQKGNRVYSNEEAKEYAMSFAAIDAGIEFVATRAIGKAASKIAPKSALANAVSRGTTNAAETFNRGIGVTAAQVAKTSIKAGAPELFEEGLQDVNEKLQHNLWRKSNDQEGSYSVGDMFVGAGEAMWQALPAVVGFGVIGGGISGARTMKAFKDFQKLSPEEQHMAVMEEQNRNGHVIMQNLKNDAAANKLAKENPELYGKIVRAQGDNIGVSTAYVNVNEMAETEEGQAAIRNMVDAGLTTQDEVSKAITADAPIEIPIGSYAQLSGGLSEETVKALEESSYFTRGGLSMKTLERAKEEVHAMKDLVKDDTEKRAERVKNDIIRSYFDEVSDVDKEMLDVVLADPTHIKQTFNNVYKKLTEQYREQYTSDFNAMDTDLETARTSGVNPIWLGDNKPPRSNSERRRMAYQSSLARTQNALADNPEALNQAGAHYADMEHTLKQIESLESMRDKLFELADNDIALRMQLSKSGYKVYQSLKSIMSDASVDRKQRDTAEANALLMAQHADIMADIMRRAGRGNYTAMDYFNTVRIDMKGELKGQKGLNQVKQSDVKLAKDQAEWVHTLKEYNPKSNAFVKIMDTPLVLQMIGGLDYDVVIKQSKIADIQVKHPEITLNEMEQLPFALADPVAIFKSSTVKDSIVVMAEMKADNGLNVVIPMQLNKTKRNNTIVYSLVNSVYTKDTVENKWYQDYLENPEFGTPLYINEQKVTNWYLAEGLSLPQAKYHISDFFNVSIPNEKDLDKLRKQYNYQSINGMTTIKSPTDRLIQIFKTADRSTFLHEMGHVFFDDIKNLAKMENVPEQLVTDWNKLKEWSEWDDAQGADNTKAHEKFARGWEAYLREGKAPTKGLQRVFRMFSKWLTRIYRAVTRLGGLPPKEIQDIMARMIATQEDIDAYTKEQALEQFESSKLFKQLDEAEQAKVQSHIADVGEMAKERVMKRYMKELESRPIKEWNDEKDSIQADIEKRLMEQYPIYKDHQRYNAFGKNALANTRYGTLKELEAAEREQTGFTFNEAVNQAMESAEQTFIEDNHIGKSNIEIAEEWILSSDGQMKLTEEEAKIIKSQTNRDLAKNWELLDKLNRLDPNSETIESELEPIEKQIVDDNKKVAKELGAAVKELDSAQDRIEKLKAQLQERINNVRAIRDSGVGVISDYMNRARQELGDLTLSQASQYKKYQNQAISEGKRADRALAVNKLEEALQAKQLQLLNQARARVAFDNALRIKKLRTKLLDNLNRMTRPKNPIAIEPNMRYFYAHMAYQMGLTKYDGLEPVDGFNMNAVINALDPDADILGDQSITFLDPWIVQLFYGKTPMSFKNLTMSQLNTLEELMTGMYKNGRNAYEGSTILNDKGESITFDDAVDGILTEAIDTFGKVNGNVFNAQNNQTGLEAVAGLINKGNLSLLKVETFLRRLGPNAVKYIYDPISRATQAFNERKEVSMRRLAKDVSSVYGKRELFNIRNKHMYDVGELRNLTKEQVIALALNWGTERNRQRAMETAKITEVEMEKAFQEILTDKDWEFIIRTWDHINSFYEERSKVQEELYGNPLKKEEGITFTIGGRTIIGQYYPIVYNPEVNASISDKEVEDIAKTMVSSNAILGTGMSATKSRLDVVKDKSLLLDFDVIPNAITESINHITMRKAVTDVNRLVANREFQNYIVEKFGMNSYQFLRTWVRDNWKDEAAKLDAFGKIVTTLKRNTSMAIMAGRVSVAIQNTLNIPVAVYRIGAGNVLQAVNHAGVGFYGHGTETYNNTRDFVLEQSIFMRERIQTLDKDLKKGLTIQGKGLRINDKNIGGYKFEKGAEIRDEINNMGFRLLTETDFALSIPVWKFAYDQKIAELQSKEGLSTEWINQQAIEAGDRAIRDIFGSGDTKDAASIQRSRSQWVQLFVPFYSYANTLYNIIAEGWYAGKDKGDWTQFARMLWWSVFSQAIGMVIYKAMTNGDDDDPESIAKSFAEEFVQQGTMGIPLVRDIATMGMKFILGERPYNKGNTVMGLSIFEKLWDTGQAISSDNKDIVDVGRSLSQVSNRVTGFSDTVTDAFWTLLRVGLTDTDAKIEDVFMSILLDKRLKTKKEKKKKQ